MLPLLSLVLFIAGFLALRFDRRIARGLRARVSKPWRRHMRQITDWAKGLHWIAFSALAYGVAQAMIASMGESPALRRLSDFSLALLASLVLASAVLHTAKFLFGRRRPRDDFEHGLYGLKPFAFDTQFDSFPSGHAMTIFCLAVVLSAALPAATPLFFLGALWLAMTRALLVAHFLSDVLIGAAMGVIAAYIILRFGFPSLAPDWF